MPGKYNPTRAKVLRKKSREDHLAAGLCARCSLPALPNRSMCEVHKKQYARARQRRAAAIRTLTIAYRDRKNARMEEIAGRPKPDHCEICGGTGCNGRGRGHNGIVFDHCHVEGHFRGWICDRCNRILGLAKDSRELLEKLSRYLQENEAGEIDHATKRELMKYGLRFAG